MGFVRGCFLHENFKVKIFYFEFFFCGSPVSVCLSLAKMKMVRTRFADVTKRTPLTGNERFASRKRAHTSPFAGPCRRPLLSRKEKGRKLFSCLLLNFVYSCREGQYLFPFPYLQYQSDLSLLTTSRASSRCPLPACPGPSGRARRPVSG